MTKKEYIKELKKAYNAVANDWNTQDIDIYFARGLMFALKLAEKLEEREERK